MDFRFMQKKRNVLDKATPFICILAPLICFFIDKHSAELFGGYVFAEELIIVNGLLTFAGLLLVSRKKTSEEIKFANDRNNKSQS